MKTLYRCLIVAGLLWIPSARIGVADEVGIPVVGIDREGHSKAVTLSLGQFQAAMAGATRAVHASVSSTLPMSVPGHKWKLTMVLVGLGVELEAGIGSLASFRASSEFNLIYSNKDGPAVP